MRTRLILLTLSLYLAFTTLACNKPPADTNADNSDSATSGATDTAKSSKEHHREGKAEAREEKKKEPVIVPSGTSITVSLGSALGSKISQPGQSFTGTVAQDITVGNEVVILRALRSPVRSPTRKRLGNSRAARCSISA